jgi:predicted hydrocarbon binding protein
VGALALAVNFGYTVTMLGGPACYIVAGALAETLE